MRVNSGKRGISGWRGLAVRTRCLSETYPIIFSTGRAGLMFHFRKHPLPLDPRPDVWHHPWPFPCRRWCPLLDRDRPRLNLDRRRKARDTSTITPEVNYDAGLIRSAKFHQLFVSSYTKSVSQHQTLSWTVLPLVIRKMCTPGVTRSAKKAATGADATQRDKFFSREWRIWSPCGKKKRGPDICTEEGASQLW